MCDTINKLKDNPQLREDIIRMRLVLIAGYGQLQAILGSINDKNVEQLSKELRTWVRKMGRLNEEGMQIIKPGPRIVSKGKKSKEAVKEVMEFQGLTDEEMKEALKEYND